ncbi:DapH/DapD/GlmU-related protein [Corynebacterium tapiri]|uniref:Succinyltransferase n=1 Tax=Corynebacterium tapiri TaxID=1448266 RepID=A0A5C4U739_9CORY|nr:DapH/DapD/GlmU-related protein [Corynebacterium tapiri]TNM00564.1 succinyltransferase [Corynebacterium tapiri]
MSTRGAEAIGLANIAMDGTVLDTWYPEPRLCEAGTSGTHRLGAADLPQSLYRLVGIDEQRGVEYVAVHTTIADLDAEPIDVHDVYLRLHLLSHRMVKPLEVNLDSAMDHLNTVAWTNKGPCKPDNFEYLRTHLRSRGLIHVYGISKIPRMVDYVVPADVSISEADRVALGAYLAPGTTVTREGYVSFNAGTLGPCRLEGRLSSGAVVGTGCDIGPSATITSPTDEQGNRPPTIIGKNCHMGVGSGVVGVSLGDDCLLGPAIVLEANTQLVDPADGRTLTGAEISGRSHMVVAMEAGYSVPTVRQR